MTDPKLAPNPMHQAQPAGTHPPAPKGPPVTDDLVRQILAAIEETERAARGSGVVAWATYLHADGSIKYTSPVSGGGGVWITAGKQTEPDSVRVVFDERAVLRRCAADRRRLERHSYFTRSGCAPDYELTCRHDSSEWPCEDLTDLADSYGITWETRVDLSGVDLSAGSSPADLDRVAAEHGVEATLTWEGYFPHRKQEWRGGTS